MIADAGIAPESTGLGREASLLDAVLDATTASDRRALADLDRFLEEPLPERAIALWLRKRGLPRGPLRRGRVARLLNQDIARLDALLSAQVNAILHHPRFQQLEGSWRGLHYLIHQVAEGDHVKIRVLDLSWKDLSRDIDKALEFDQSQLFRKVYGEEFGTAGGEPFGVLLGDYEIRHRPGPGHPIDDLATLAGIATVAAAAFAPFITGAHPALLDLESFADLERPLNLARTFDQLDYLKWRAFRDSEDARFIGLTLPRVLRRLPYRDGGRADGFRFREEIEKPDRSQYLWGNAVYAFGGVLIRAFAESGWLASIRGVQQDVVTGGLVTGLPAHCFALDPTGAAPKCTTDVVITDLQERELSDLGFIPLSHCQHTNLAAFYSNQSVQKPAVYDELPATMNARLSAMLQYVLCVSRFAHYIKVISRDRLGVFQGPADCEEYLRRWLLQYTTANDKAGPELKAQFPLRDARVQIAEWPGKPGHYRCIIQLRPHYQLDRMVTGVRLVTELSPGLPGTA